MGELTTSREPCREWVGCVNSWLPVLQVKATVQNGDLMHAADMLCSISFDRDDEFFATAGVSRRIKVCQRLHAC